MSTFPNDYLEEDTPYPPGMPHEVSAQISMAVSLKRIADNLEKLNSNIELYVTMKD